uniref:Uncharacterized protein n=1 Tax=Anopheles darlingi TaxID=43151 RepID=A0A2M4DQC0_ANODA
MYMMKLQVVCNCTVGWWTKMKWLLLLSCGCDETDGACWHSLRRKTVVREPIVLPVLVTKEAVVVVVLLLLMVQMESGHVG